MSQPHQHRKTKKKKPYVPQRKRARYNAQYVTYVNGRRLVRWYYYGEPLQGMIV